MKVNIHEAKTQFSKLVERALSGEEIIIAKNGNPLLTLVPIANQNKNRIPGLSSGKGKIAKDFDAPLGKKILREFEK